MSNTVVGLLTAELIIELANSLKDKRQVLKSVLAHLRSDFNVSAAEVADHDVWRKATIAVAAVASDGRFVNEVLDKVVDHIERDPRIELGHYEMEAL